MKRGILCLACDPERKAFERKMVEEPETVFDVFDYASPPERTKHVYGTAKRNFLCDVCGNPIASGERCAAVTTVIAGAASYWEDNYIMVEQEANNE